MADTRITGMDTTAKSSVSYSGMAQYNDTSIYSDFYSIPTKETEGTNGTETWYNLDWQKWHGIYRNIPELAAIIDKLANWTVGKGYKCDSKTKKILKRIKGFGKDDFNTLMENTIRTALIGGDSFAEIIKDKAGRLINLKPLNSGSIRIVVDKWGMIARYEQLTLTPDVSKPIKFKPKEMFHLSWNRIADEIHGIPFPEKLEWLIQMRNESMQDQKVLFHRYVKPLTIISVDTDDSTEIAAFKAKWDMAYQKSENIIVPHETVKEIQRISIPQYSTLDPMPWLKYLVRVFTTSCGVPEVVMGWGEETTEASAKIIYLAFQQTIERLQRYMEAQLELQLNIKINLEFPASIEPEAEQKKEVSIKDDAKKDSSLSKESVDPSKNSK